MRLARWRYERTLGASLSDVEKILFDVSTGKFSSTQAPFILQGSGEGTIDWHGGDEFLISYNDGHKAYLTIDRSNHTLLHRGEWWYGGLYKLRATSISNTTVVYEVHNVAPSFRWLVHFITRNMKGMEENFEAFIARLNGALSNMQL